MSDGAPSCDSPELAAIRERLANVQCRGDRTWTEVDALALLRMVDELTKERDRAIDAERYWSDDAKMMQEKRQDAEDAFASANATIDHITNRWYAITKERDDLRAKLATVSREYADVAHAIGIAYEADGHPIVPGPVERIIEAVREDQHKAWLADELEAKLAEAEKTVFSLEAGVRDLEIERRDERERAEAAEARVRQLQKETHKLSEALFRACGGHVDLDKLEGR